VPDVGTVRATVAAIAHEDSQAAKLKALAPMPMADDEGPRFFCLNCHDEPAGWRPFWCPGTGSGRTFDRPDRADGSTVECGKHRAHTAHQYVHRCECYETNPVIAEHRRREVRRASEKKARRRGDAA